MSASGISLIFVLINVALKPETDTTYRAALLSAEKSVEESNKRRLTQLYKCGATVK